MQAFYHSAGHYIYKLSHFIHIIMGIAGTYNIPALYFFLDFLNAAFIIKTYS